MTRGYSFGIEDPKQLGITADGAWKVRIAPATSAPAFTGTASGKGPAVLRYDGQATRIAATHDGESNFIITSYQSNATMGDLVVNEIGVYSGVVVLRKNLTSSLAPMEIGKLRKGSNAEVTRQISVRTSNAAFRR